MVEVGVVVVGKGDYEFVGFLRDLGGEGGES